MRFRNRTRKASVGFPERSPSGSRVTRNPYSPASHGYAERAQETEIEVIGSPGMKRVDVGNPVPRQHGEPQPVPRGTPSARPAVPAAPSASAPAAPEREPKEPDLRPGLGKHTRR